MLNIKDGIIVSESGDGGDSARAHGIAELFAPDWHDLKSILIFNQGFYRGIFTRNPFQKPWDNWKNFSRDQLICLTAGLWSQHLDFASFWVLKTHKDRWWFCQNFERDYPGTTKYPWPHKMKGGDPADNGKWRMFDFSDPLFPHHILHLYNCARMKAPWWVKWFGSALLWLSVRFNSRKTEAEQNQLMCMVKVAGPYWVSQYKKYNPWWRHQVHYYWVEQRNCQEMYDLIEQGF